MGRKRNHLQWISTAICFVALLFCCTHISLAQTGRWVEADGTMQPVVESAEIISSAGIDGESLVTVIGTDMVQVSLGTMTMPGAYAEIRVTVTNIGNLSANLTKVTKTGSDPDRILIYFPDIPVEDEPAMEEGDSCTFSVVVQWDPEDTTDTDGLETGTFAMTLTYENDEMVFVADIDDETNDNAEAENAADNRDAESGSAVLDVGNSDSTAVTAVSTGDSSVILLWYLLSIAAGAGFLVCLRCSGKRNGKV